MTVSPRRAREIARTRQDILEAAARAFAQNDFKAVTMQEIAKEAGYTAASLYSYFSSKEEIIQGLRDLILQELDSVFEIPIPVGISLREKLELLLSRQLEVGKRRFELVALLYIGGGLPDADRIREIHERRLDLYVDFLRKHATADELGGRDLRDVSLLIAGMAGAFISHWVLNPEEGWLEEKLPLSIDVLLGGLGGTTK